MLVIVAGILNLVGCDEHDHKYEVVVLGKGSKDRQYVQLHVVSSDGQSFAVNVFQLANIRNLESS